MEAPFEVLLQVTGVLDELGIAYVVVGSLASSLHGLYRTTGDIDLIAKIKQENLKPLTEMLKQHFYADELAIRRAVTHHRSFNVIHFDSAFKVDIFVPADAFSQQQLERRIITELSPDIPRRIYVATPEDTVLAKLRWYRAGNEVARNQWTDVLGIIGTQSGLDLDYMRMWANKLGVSDLLDKALNELN